MSSSLKVAIMLTCALILGLVGHETVLGSLTALVPLPEHATTQELAEPVEVKIKLEPLGLECRAYLYGETYISFKKEHQLGSRTYRTDTLEIMAYLDVDLCLPESAVIVEEGISKTIIIYDASELIWRRPRVDASRTQTYFSKGAVGKLTDVAPWVEENSSLYDDALAFTQERVLQACADPAEEAIKGAIKASYLDKYGEDVDVVMAREFNLPSGNVEELDTLSGIDIELREVTCEVS